MSKDERLADRLSRHTGTWCSMVSDYAGFATFWLPPRLPYRSDRRIIRRRQKANRGTTKPARD